MGEARWTSFVCLSRAFRQTLDNFYILFNRLKKPKDVVVGFSMVVSVSRWGPSTCAMPLNAEYPVVNLISNEICVYY